MARKNRTSPLEDIVIIASKFPWWISVILAVVSFLTASALPSQNPGNLVSPIFALFGQFFLAPAFLIGAGISAFNSMKQRRLYETVHARVTSVNEMNYS